MKFLSGTEKESALEFLIQPAEVAKDSTCDRSHCGSIIVNEDKIIGRGFNSPPGNKEESRRCSCEKYLYTQKVTDKTCCVHAEQRAIMDALRTNPEDLIDSRLYFIRLDDEDNPAYSGKPYCTICSKMALDVGIKEFVLFHKEGICVYETKEYNDWSFNYKE
jgi:deoxycytidylate deaminase